MPDDVPAPLKIQEPTGTGNSPREQVVRDFVVAVQEKDLEHLRQWLVDDVQWEVVGFQTLEGVEPVLAWVGSSRDNVELSFNGILTDDRAASVDGRVTNVRNISVAFSYIITFAGTDPADKIKAVRSYLVSKPVA